MVNIQDYINAEEKKMTGVYRMRITFILLSFILGISFTNFSIEPCTNAVYRDTTIVYDNGYMKFITPYRDGFKHGLEYRILSAEGDTIEIIEHKMGKLNGKSLVFYKGRRLQSVRFFKNDYKIGKWLSYDTLGNVVEQTTFDSLYHNEDPRWSGKVTTFEANKPVFTQVWTNGRRSDIVVHNSTLYAAYKAKDISLGTKLYNEECASCHTISRELVGPALAESFNKRQQDWLIKFILNGDALYQAGDTTVKSLYKKYGQIKHPDFSYLKNSDVEAIIQFVRKKK